MLFQRTTSAYEDAIRQRSSILSAASDLSYIEGVRLEDLVELLLVALQSMAQHSAARTTIIGAPEGVFASFVQVCLLAVESSLIGQCIELFNCFPLLLIHPPSICTAVRNTSSGHH